MDLFGHCRSGKLVSRIGTFSSLVGPGWACSNLSSGAVVKLSSPTLLKQTKLWVLPQSSVQFVNFSSDASSSPLSREHIDKIVNNNKVVVFMKGVPEEPKCGFSNAVVQIFRMHGVSKYDSHNVLADENIRQGIKEYTNWPTIPQVFINGEFIGGCDILIEMHKNGELIEQLSKVGIKSALLEQEESNNKDGTSNK